MKAPNFKLEMKGDRKAIIEIYDGIGPSWAGMIDAPTVSKAINEAGPLDSITVRINSPGGSVFEGVAIHNILKNHSAKVHTVVDGVAASIASVVMMAGDTIEVPKNALVMIHDPSMITYGGEKDMQKAAELLAKVKSQIVDTYAKRTGKAPEAIAQMMSDETWMTGDEAVTNGFANQVAADLPIQASATVAATFSNFNYSRAPESLGSLYSLAMTATRKEPEPMAEKTADQIAAEAKTAADLKATQDAAAATALAAKNATDIANAVEAERNRAADITAVCAKAGKPDLASKFITDKASLADVQARLLDAMCAERKPSDDVGSDPVNKTADPDAAYKAEYAQHKDLYVKNGIKTEADYVAMRRIDDGKDSLQKLGG
jgi:ATP-dependent Clp endopeptidase proteolytic subunit ClpP